LAIIDPFTAFLSTRTCSLNDQMIRQVLTPLAQVADVRRVALVVVRHLNKNSRGQPALYRGSGSIAIVGAARTAHLVGRSPYDPARRVLACTKINIGLMPQSLGFEIESGERDRPRIRWTGPIDLSADDLVLSGGLEHGEMLRRAKLFLGEVLRDG